MTRDVVEGYKPGRSDPLHRKIIARVSHHIAKLMFSLSERDTDCDYRRFRRTLIEPRQLTSTSGVICVEMVCLRWRMVARRDSSRR